MSSVKLHLITKGELYAIKTFIRHNTDDNQEKEEILDLIESIINGTTTELPEN